MDRRKVGRRGKDTDQKEKKVVTEGKYEKEYK